MKEINVFVYGTLKPGGYFWPHYCEGKVLHSKPAKTRGLLYALDRGYPGMVKAEGDCWVSGYLLTIESEEVLAGFDELEDFDTKRPAKENEYNREMASVYALSGKKLADAWVYYMTPKRVEEFNGVFCDRGLWTPTSFANVNFSSRAHA